MLDLERNLPEIEAGRLMQEIRESLRRLERRDWWLWAATVVVMLLLTVAVVSFTWPTLMSETNRELQLNVNIAVRGLVGLVLLFNTYVIYQQVLIKRLRGQMARQIEMMAELKYRAEEFHRLATLDPLTGLFNRRVAEQRLIGEVNRSERHGYPLTVLTLDLDGFKLINDRFGHAAGDLVLRELGGRLRAAIRASDLAVRLGGDEFLLILPECQPDQVRVLLDRITPYVVNFEGATIPVSASAGWAGFRKGESAEELLQRADEILYENKRNHKLASPVAVVT